MSSPPTETLTLPHPAPIRGLEPGTIVGDKYRLVAPIGVGGMGAVWLAVYTSALGRSCAVKFLADSAPAARKRFLDEAQIMGALRHPNIVTVFDHGIDVPTGLAFYVMDEYLPTPADTIRLCRDILHCPPPAPRLAPAPLSLARLLDGGKTLPEDTILAVARQLLSAIEAAHALSPPVIHRDIKPSNILFAPDGRALLTDFGIAKRLPAPPPADAPFSVPSDPSPTLPGATPGTPAYAAPEQLAGNPVTVAADFYSFGVVLYCALSGGMPGPTVALPSDIAPHVSRAWQKLFAGLLESDPASRLVQPTAIRALFDNIGRDIRRRSSRRWRLALYVAAGLAIVAVLLAATRFSSRARPAPVPDAPQPAEEAPAAPAPAAQEWLRRYQESTTAAKNWVARYLDGLHALLGRVIDAVPDADNVIHVGPGQILLSGDISPLSPAPTLLLDGGTLLFSPGLEELRALCDNCAYYLEHAPDTAPLPDFLPAIVRDTFSAPIRLGAKGCIFNSVDSTKSALGLEPPDDLAPAEGRWRDLLRYDLFIKSPIHLDDGVESAIIRIAPDAPDLAFSGLSDEGIQLRRMPNGNHYGP